ncbi:shikimate dehydrogenase [Idiomarina xiamenensis]|uniref:Shikimate dehydrogenase (NADP(+)) n=1 Tax=Idiomarina xiamenensis 10-D-4 TaxID=740709 RepID=K2KLI0_9GAMM|nr:shikimate dehydrogenase [Idiomarina xiamenensis]EKE83389.1 shikimate 5-dehydrogenase [Idiomarina xiamenensis 10-D-4]
MNRFTLFGNPVSHSRSPLIHQAFANQRREQLNYCCSLTSTGQFRRAVARFFREGGAGANVTTPFKGLAYQLCSHVTVRAQQAKAVNTLVPLGHGQLLGDNTDGLGLVADLQRDGERLTGLSVCILGAGGAAQGVIGSLLAAGVAQITLVNRTHHKAQRIAALWQARGAPVQAAAEVSACSAVDLLINATSMSLQGERVCLPKQLVKSEGRVYDMMYGQAAQQFLQWAADCGIKRRQDGLGMLVEQAAYSYVLWHDGNKPDTNRVLTQLQQQLGESPNR